MSSEQKSSWTTYIVVAAVSAVIGFAAIYVIVSGNDNGTAQQTTSLTEAVKSAQPAAKAANSAAGAEKSGKLNVGKMVTFVFKKEPQPVPEAKFNDAGGKAITLADFKGKVVLLNLWATWCAPCRKEMPHLDQLQAELGSDGFEVVAISIDRGSPEKSRKFLDEINAKALKLYHDPSAQLSFTLKTIGMPSTLLIDAEGRELGRLVGPAEWHSADAKRLIQAQLQ